MQQQDIVGTGNLVIGKSVQRRDLPGKLTGNAKYTADIKLPGMLHGKILRSVHPFAHINSINSSKTLELSGVFSTLTPFDVPTGHIALDMPILDTTVRFVGDEVAAVAATDEDIAQQAIELIDVSYSPLPFVLNAEDALKPDAPKVHETGNLIGSSPIVLSRGDVKEGFRNCDHIFEETFTTPAHSGSALEPRAVIAMWEGDFLTIWKCSRGVHSDRKTISSALCMDSNKVRVIGPPLGGGFGNKDESRLATIVAILAYRSGRPVKIELSREEEFIAGRCRHSTSTRIKIGVSSAGIISAIQVETIMNTGAYLASGPGVIRRAGQAALYLYRCPNVRYDGYLVYTNRPSAGSYRALGAPQGHFALEVMVDKIAHALRVDPLDFRLMNHVDATGQPGIRVTPPNEIIETQPVEGGIPFSSNGLRQCLNLGSSAINWRKRKVSHDSDYKLKKTGIGMSIFIYRGGPGGEAKARVKLNQDGTVQLITGLMDVGEGATTVLCQIAANELSIPYDSVRGTFADTYYTPNAPVTAGSSATFSTGLAVQRASRLLKNSIISVAAYNLDVLPSELRLKNGHIYQGSSSDSNISVRDIGYLTREMPLEMNTSLMPGSKDFIINSFGAHFALVEVDLATGQVEILQYVAAHDSGQILNPSLAVNQVEGGISQMIGFTLTEEMVIDDFTGGIVNPRYLEHKSPTILDIPPIEVIFADVFDPEGPFGAKALGELPSIGVAPAIVNAIHDAIGIWVHDLPASPNRILELLDNI